MTVRWKPLLILSGVFVAVALGGLVAFTLVRGSRGTEGILAKARAELKAKRFEEAEVEFKRALQREGRNPAIHLEFAGLYDEWLREAPADKRVKVELAHRGSLADAAKFGPTLVVPRRALLADAIDQDEHAEAVRWATELVKLDPADPTAHYVLASDLLDATSPNMSEIRRHQVHVDKATPRTVRAIWLAARIAQAAKDDAELKAALVASRSVKEIKGLASVDAMALLRLRALDIQTIDDPATLADRVKSVNTSAEALTAGDDVASTRIARVGRVMETVQKSLLTRHQEKSLDDSVEAVSEAIFQKALAAKNGADLGVYFAYADHLRFRDKRKECLDVIERAFKAPVAARQATGDAALSLHALAVHAILTANDDPARFEQSAPHIKALLDGPNARFRAFGHMYQGQADIEQLNALQAKNNSGSGSSAEAKFRTSALEHLKAAAIDLPELAEAQARYGVALILTRETELGRVYLQKAATLGNLEPRYLIWAAWAMVHGGYPEYAEPIVTALLAEVDAGKLGKDMAGVLHLVYAEIHQAKKTPDELAKAIESYQKAFANGQKPTATVQLRLAQIELMLNRPDDAFVRLDAMSKAGQDSPSCELLAVNTLRGQKKFDLASARLKKARAKFPRSSELISLEAEILVAESKAEEADRLVAEALIADPENTALVELRSWILADPLKKPAEARALLGRIAERSERSSPLVRLAQLDIQGRDFDAASATIAKIRNRWKEAAVADMLDAQVAIGRGNTRLAATYYDAALKKDPNNKLIQYWKAQLDGLTDPQAAAKVLETLANSDSVKEVDTNVSLMTAAQSALANIQLETGDIDGAIARYQGLLKENGTSNVARDLRWKLVSANIAKKQWPAAKAEIQSILDDKSTPATPEERIAAAIYFRNNKEDAAAKALVESVLKEKPDHPWAVSVETQLLATTDHHAEAKALVRRAIDSSKDKSKTPAAFYLLLAAVENSMPPVADSLPRAIAAIDEGMVTQPNSVELAQAKARLLGLNGDRKGAIAFIAAKAKNDPKGPFSRMLINLLRDDRDYAGAEKVAADLLKESPTDATLAVSLVRLVAAQAIEANGKGEKANLDTLNARTAAMIRDFRTKFPEDPTFLQLDCELAVRRGETTRAVSLTQEIDKLAKGSSLGAMLRAQIYSTEDRPREVAAAYTEALERNPRQPEIRLMLAQTDLRIGDFDQALRNARMVLETDPEQAGALLIQARALSASAGTPSQVAANRTTAIATLTEALKKRPTFSEAYHLIAEVHSNNGSTSQAIATLKDGLKAVPNDANGLSILVRLLCQPTGPGKPADPKALAEAKSLAEEYAGKDKSGALCQAVAVGFHRSGQFHLALPWAEKAATLSNTQTVQLNLGDLLLSIAETSQGTDRTEFLNRALAQFDRVLKDQPNNVEAINNKAWILHTYLNKSREGLELAEGLIKRVDPATLPAEFFDTLGEMQVSAGRTREAEETFGLGLRKAPKMPMLNFHMAKLIASDTTRAGKAAGYLETAKAGVAQLTPEMAAEIATLGAKVNR
jgi:predicted Zn-dependent protease